MTSSEQVAFSSAPAPVPAPADDAYGSFLSSFLDSKFLSSDSASTESSSLTSTDTEKEPSISRELFSTANAIFGPTRKKIVYDINGATYHKIGIEKSLEYLNTHLRNGTFPVQLQFTIGSYRCSKNLRGSSFEHEAGRRWDDGIMQMKSGLLKTLISLKEEDLKCQMQILAELTDAKTLEAYAKNCLSGICYNGRTLTEAQWELLCHQVVDATKEAIMSGMEETKEIFRASEERKVQKPTRQHMSPSHRQPQKQPSRSEWQTFPVHHPSSQMTSSTGTRCSRRDYDKPEDSLFSPSSSFSRSRSRGPTHASRSRDGDKDKYAGR